jgi:hypothetical protein
MRLPDDSEQLAIVGMNGSGKTVAGVWHLAQRSWDRMPWFVLNFKSDELINEIADEFGKNIDLTDKLPKKPGLYVIDVLPESEEEMEKFFQALWSRGKNGLYTDEGYMIKNRSKWFRAILTQGRAKKVPTITLSQRPVYMDRFVFSEASFHQVFFLADDRDIDTVSAFAPMKKMTGYSPTDLPKYYSFYYDVKGRKMEVLRPVPDRGTILALFKSRANPGRRFFL